MSIHITAPLGMIMALALVACQSGAPQQGSAPAATAETDALVAGTNYHATGDIECTIGADAATGMCPFGVIREGNGSGSVIVTKPDGRTRAIFFADGAATGYDVSEADPGEFSATRDGDDTIVFIGAERYVVPDAVIFGG
ncbi:MAG: hypothetical protein R3F55_24415 [Alphaproteobacteria bacterium]